MNFKKSIIGLATCAVLGMSATVSAAPIVIDLFETDSSLLRVDTGTLVDSTIVTTLGTDIIGGERDMILETELASTTTAGSSMIVENGELVWDNGTNAYSAGTIQWDGADNSTVLSFGLDLDLADMFFEVITTASDLGFEFSVGLYNDADTWTVLTLESSGVDTTNSPATSYLDLNTFALSALPAFAACSVGDGIDDPFGDPAVTQVLNMSCGTDGFLDLAHVTAIELILDPNLNGITNQAGSLDIAITSIRAVPEPTSLALLGLGLIGFGAARRNARKS